MSHFDTLAVHAGEEPDPETGALRTPLHMSTTFRLPRFGIKLFDALTMDSARPPYAYSRWSNPTVRALERPLASLEGAEAGPGRGDRHGGDLGAGAHLPQQRRSHHRRRGVLTGAVELFGLHLPRFGIEVSLVDTSDLDQVRAALRPNTRIVYAETPANPILRLAGRRRAGRDRPRQRARCWSWIRPGPARPSSGRSLSARTLSSTA